MGAPAIEEEEGSGEPLRGVSMRTLHTAQPLLWACHGAGRGRASRWQEPRPWAHTGGSPEAAVCLGGEHFGDPFSPGALPRVGFLPWQTADVGGGRGRPGSLRTPAAIWVVGGGRAEPLRVASGWDSRSPGPAASLGAGGLAGRLHDPAARGTDGAWAATGMEGAGQSEGV